MQKVKGSEKQNEKFRGDVIIMYMYSDCDNALWMKAFLIRSAFTFATAFLLYAQTHLINSHHSTVIDIRNTFPPSFSRVFSQTLTRNFRVTRLNWTLVPVPGFDMFLVECFFYYSMDSVGEVPIGKRSWYLMIAVNCLPRAWKASGRLGDGTRDASVALDSSPFFPTRKRNQNLGCANDGWELWCFVLLNRRIWNRFGGLFCGLLFFVIGCLRWKEIYSESGWRERRIVCLGNIPFVLLLQSRAYGANLLLYYLRLYRSPLLSSSRLWDSPW